jgi:pyruvate,water dikinase
VLVAPNPFPGLITVMGKVRALVTEVGGVASHMATLAREYRIPTLAGVEHAGKLPAGQLVTVDATGSAIYAGIHPDLVAARRGEYELFGDTAIFDLLEQVLAKVSPLNLLHPSDPDFVPEHCRTFHDITRFAHQKAMEEMFYMGKDLKHKDRISARLKSQIPLQVLIIHLDQDVSATKGRRVIDEKGIDSVPMQAFWNGIKEEGWPSRPPPATLKGFMSVMATDMSTGSRAEFSESSFAIVSREYMILSLRMGYHFMTIEAMCTDEVSKNYIRMQFKGGGASLDRRVLRVKLLMDILSKAAFEHSSKGDFIDTMISYQGPKAIVEKLHLLGRITMLTKQLDMALSNEAIAQWYTQDFMKKLGLEKAGEDKQ